MEGGSPSPFSGLQSTSSPVGSPIQGWVTAPSGSKAGDKYEIAKEHRDRVTYDVGPVGR